MATDVCGQQGGRAAIRAFPDFQVFVKPVGPACNLACAYCYYLKTTPAPSGQAHRMADALLERYIAQHIEASCDPEIRFSWHGGEPTLLGLDSFRRIVALQNRHRPPDRTIANGIQTNGTLLDEAWCRFLAAEGFAVGISLDGPARMHDLHRRTKEDKPTYEQVMRGYRLLQQYRVPCEILCVVNARNVRHPIEVYRFFKEIEAGYVTFLPLVERQPDGRDAVSERSVPPVAWGDFLCAVFDEWQAQDIGRVKVQIFEEAARPAFGQGHTLCVFRETCGGVPVVEHNGDFFSCDHFVDPRHRIGNIQDARLVDLLEDPRQRAFGRAKLETLPQYCRSCQVRAMCNGGCPKNRLLRTPDGEAGLEYLCAGYKRFFTHCRPFVEEVGALWRRQEAAQARSGPILTSPAPGRNSPCPCGSGKKYKKCCGA